MYRNQSLTEDSDKQDIANAPEMEQALALGPNKTDTSMINKVYTGEVISSFRQLLKRYNIHTSFGPFTPAGYSMHLEHSMFPYLRGNVPGAVHTAAGLPPVGYNFCNTVMLHWVVNCFSGWRGSVRYKVVPRGARDNALPTTLSVTRWDNYANSGYAFAVNPLPSYTSVSTCAEYSVNRDVAGQEFANQIALPTPNGLALTVGDINPCLEYEVPFYSDQRFIPGKNVDWTSSFTTSGAALDVTGDGTPTTLYEHHVAAGEDFQVYFWTACPPLFYEPAPPTPT